MADQAVLRHLRGLGPRLGALGARGLAGALLLLLLASSASPLGRAGDSASPYKGKRLGALSNEALPPAEEDKFLEKQHHGSDKWRMLKEAPPPVVPSPGGLEPLVQGSRNRPVEAPTVYVVEHEISNSQAKLAIRLLNISNLPETTGCMECTPKEMQYCAGFQVINDHCCCDKSYLGKGIMSSASIAALPLGILWIFSWLSIAVKYLSII